MQKDHEEIKKQITNRLSRVIGQLRGVKRMVEGERECGEVLTQIAAARAALDSTSKIILQNHIDYCIKNAVERNDENAIQDLNNILGKFIR